MLDRRTLIAGGIALGMAGAGQAKPSSAGKRKVIDDIVLPAGFNGAIAYGRNGRLIHLRTAGMADVEARKPVTPATQFKFGSISKWLTSVAILRLVEQGQLDLDEPIGDQLPGLPSATASQVKLWHLLSNTSGIPDLVSRQVKIEPALRTSTASPSEIVSRFAGGDLAFKPGEGWDYAALNWVIVAAIIERRTGMSVPDLVQRSVFRPLDMRGAGFVQPDRPALPKLAAAYGASLPSVRKMAPVPAFMAATGNMAGTIADAMRAGHGIFHGKLLTAASRAALTTLRWQPQKYALGGRVNPIEDKLWAWETGKVEGYRAHIAHRLDDSETIVVFNTTDMAQDTIGGWVTDIARG